MTAEVTNNNYWTPIPIDYHSIYPFKKEVQQKFVEYGISTTVSEISPCATYQSGTFLCEELVFFRGSFARRSIPTFDKVKNDIKVKFNLVSESEPQKYIETTDSISFMYKGIKITVLDFLTFSEDEKSKEISTPETSVSIYLYGFPGLVQTLNILLKKFSMEIVRGNLLYYYKDEVSNEIKTFNLSCSLEDICTVIGIPLRTSHGYSLYNGFKDAESVLNWIFSSPYFSAEDFHVHGSSYDGPQDYYNIPMFKTMVKYLIEDTGPNFKYPKTPKLTTEVAISKIRASISSHSSFNSVMDSIKRFSNSMMKKKLINAKYSEGKIKDFLQVSDKQAKDIDSEFRNFVNQKEDFEFFILSSSEDTIFEKLKQFATSNAKPISEGVSIN